MIKGPIYNNAYNADNLETISQALLGNKIGGKYKGLTGPEFELSNDSKKKCLDVFKEVKPLSQFSANFEYHHAVQGFIYSLLCNLSSPFHDLHDKKAYKFFCFSNMFAGQDQMFNLIVSSPNNKLIEEISNELSRLIETHSPIQIGVTKFDLQKIIIFSYKNLVFPLKIITSTPIVIRIPQQKVIREIGSNSVSYREVYWRNNYPMSLFMEGVESNLDKKYRDYTTLSVKKNPKTGVNQNTYA